MWRIDVVNFTTFLSVVQSSISFHRTRVTRLRDDYEGIFIRLLEDLKLPRGVDLHSLRLMLLGAMNWSFTWYRPGAETPRRIARKFVKYLRISLQES